MAGVKRRVIGLVAGLLLACSAHAQSALDGPWSIAHDAATRLMLIHKRTWDIACELKRRDCTNIAPPVVAYALMDAYGRHRIGSNVVLVDIRMYGQEFGALVLIHEMIHYLQTLEAPAVVEIPQAQVCRDEAEAHKLTYAFSQNSGLGKGDPRLKDWTPARALSYGCKE